MSKMIPTFKTIDGKYIYGNKVVSALLDAVHKDKTSITFDGKRVDIIESVRNNDEWTVTIEVT